MKSHRGVLQEIAEENRLKQQFVSSLAPTYEERQKKTLFHLLAGKLPIKTGRTLCDLCDRRLSDRACANFEGYAREGVKCVLKEYIAAFCPSCKEKMKRCEDVEVLTTNPVTVSEIAQMPPIESIESEPKTIIKPCGCIIDNPEKLEAVDRERLNKDAKKGLLSSDYQEEATKGVDPLDEFEPEMKGEL